MRKLLIFAFIFFTIKVTAQNKSIRTDLITPSPTAGSIAKAGDIPLNLSIGLPSLDIPIFTVEGSELSLPISLNYNYDGLKPAQSAGWVGLGWSHQAGGVITRSIRDKVDGTMGASGNYNQSVVQSVIKSVQKPEQEFLRNAPTMYDTELDIFNFNFPGYSGKFLWYNNKFYIFPSQKLKITGGTGGFIITTELGIRYHFNEIETTTPKGTNGSPYNIPSYNSSWYLSKVENPSGTDVVTLTYTSEGKLTNAGAFTQTYKKNTTSMTDISPSDPTWLSFPVSNSGMQMERFFIL